MGRWAQRRLSGGGIPNVPPNTEMFRAEILGSDQADVHFTRDVNAGDFAPTDFASLPSFETGGVIAQGTSEQLIITFTAPILTDDELKYEGPPELSKSPQTIAYT